MMTAPAERCAGFRAQLWAAIRGNLRRLKDNRSNDWFAALARSDRAGAVDPETLVRLL